MDENNVFNENKVSYLELYNALQNVAAWDKESTLDRFMNNDDLFIKFLSKFIAADPTYINLQKALEKRDVEDAMHCSHTLKGISANFGLTKLFDISDSMVSLLREKNLNDALKYQDALKEEYDALSDVVRKFCL